MLERIKAFLSGEVRGAKRDGRWPTLRKKFLEDNPTCAACGGNEELEVHHRVPVHVKSDLELDPKNLITLCEKHGCHLAFGHLFDYHSYNLHCAQMADNMLDAVRSRPK
jgi:5-methylcytosine-specific restriction protein A